MMTTCLSLAVALSNNISLVVVSDSGRKNSSYSVVILCFSENHHAIRRTIGKLRCCDLIRRLVRPAFVEISYNMYLVEYNYLYIFCTRHFIYDVCMYVIIRGLHNYITATHTYPLEENLHAYRPPPALLPFQVSDLPARSD